ncbi:hypothetical protein PhCBS80983_g01706 [Powellomyces hirtus]|uniref:Uncharacterized protein n=1 Tax=Powellomyces hirtus TaxID=109895 RepID=A0A507E9M2_9FUNG|nr:hypothetical protein PhCBS80983_g01706 [Powellomyces hirtus]
MEQITQQLSQLHLTDAVRYPFEGMLYTIMHFQDLAEPVAKSLSIALGTAFATIIPLLILTLGLQTKFVAKILGGIQPSLRGQAIFGVRLAKWLALLLCMFEAYVVLWTVLGTKLDATRAELFEDVLLSRTSSIGRYVHDPLQTLPSIGSDSNNKAQLQTLHDLAQIASTKPGPFEMLSRPLHAAVGLVCMWIPVVGPLAIAYLEGERTAVQAHHKLFSLKGMEPKERAEWVLGRREQYTQFGFVAAALEAVPVVGLVTKFTNAVGAALWAADLEERQAKLRGSSGIKHEAKEAKKKLFKL